MTGALQLTPAAVAALRAEILRARGNEVCFVARVSDRGEVDSPRAVARGHATAVLAAVGDAPPGSLVIHNHPSGDLEPSDADLAVAAALHERGLGLAIVDNDARELYVVVEPAGRRAYRELDEEEVARTLAPGGPLASELRAFEDRPAQRALAAAVARTYNRGGVLLAEAGTGTGKSVAYLVPAIAWAAANGERTVVSTNTINLQEQLVAKDLPLLRRALGTPFRFALVKGRGNYVSIRRAYLAAATASLLDDASRAELDAILEWVRSTDEGSLQDLPFTPSPETWEEVVSDADVCMRTRCPHFQACFYQRARRDAAAADILVVNHHLLFSDLAVRRARGDFTRAAVLPPYRRLVVDEAHNLEDTAAEHLGASISRIGVLRALRRLDRSGRGLLVALAERLAAARGDPVAEDALRRISAELRPEIARGRELAEQLFEALAVVAGVGEEGVVRLDEAAAAAPGWLDTVEPLAEALAATLGRIGRGLSQLRERLDLDREWARALVESLVELGGAAERLQDAASALRIALRPGRDADVPLVRWIECRGAPGRANVVVRAAPVDVSALLREGLFEPLDTVVLTSATLTTPTGFEFTRDRLGLSGGGIAVAEEVYPSPFDYASCALVAVSTDLPEPRGDHLEPYDAATAEIVAELAGISDGGLLVLFTSYRSLASVAGRLRATGVDGRWPLFVQGEAPRARLLDEFAASGRGILLGVSSFWEGVDVPGDPLRGLVIARLPFRAPGDPLTAARIEAIEANGGSSFRDYMLPHAALRLKQGFGRLIRTARDRGVVLILDPRTVQRPYGRYLLDALPPAPVVAGSWAGLRGRIEAFYRAGG